MKSKITKGLRLEFVEVDINSLETSFRKEVNKIINYHVEQAVDFLQYNSPKGVDGLLSSSWTAIAARRQSVTFDIEYKITNKDELAFNKFFGRGSGGFPPAVPLERWVKEKLQVPIPDVKSTAFLIRRKIAAVGTERSQQIAILGIRRDFSYEPGSILDIMRQNIQRDLSALKIK